MRLYLLVVFFVIAGCLKVDYMFDKKLEEMERAYKYRPDEWNTFILHLKFPNTFTFEYMYSRGAWAEGDSILFRGEYKKENDKLILYINYARTSNYGPHPPGNINTTENVYSGNPILFDLLEESKFIEIFEFPAELKLPSYRTLSLKAI